MTLTHCQCYLSPDEININYLNDLIGQKLVTHEVIPTKDREKYGKNLIYVIDGMNPEHLKK